MAEDVSWLAQLKKRATEISDAIQSASGKQHIRPSNPFYALAHDIMVGLRLVNQYLETMPVYWIQPDVEDLCHLLLQDLRAMTTPPEKTWFLARLSRAESSQLEATVLEFFKDQKAELLQRVKKHCDDLIGKLTRDEDDNDAARLPVNAVQHLEMADMSAYFNQGLFDTLQVVCQCDPQRDEEPGAATETRIWHRTRLCLNEADGDIRVLVSGTTHGKWQEFCVQTQPETGGDDDQQLFAHKKLCELLSMELANRLFLTFIKNRGFVLLPKSDIVQQIPDPDLDVSLAAVLRNYELKPKDKVLLAYAVARAYWQYYDSALMRTRWTSDAILFMPETGSEKHNGQLPLYAYLSFPFGNPDNSSEDISQDFLLTHQCPRIFDIGVLLLEIGLGKPLPPTLRKTKIVGQRNNCHKFANDRLMDLKKEHWGGFLNKKVFDRAVEVCLDHKNFIKPSNKSESHKPRATKAAQPSTAEPSTAEARIRGVLARRKLFFKHVVQPLAWLATKGYKAKSGDITRVSKKEKPKQGVPDVDPQPKEEAIFHSEIVPKKWLQDIKKISESVERMRRDKNVKTPIRIAILDTGLNRELSAFKKKPGLLRRVRDWVDYVEGASECTDTHGHGTLMARLVMESAPGAEILVARIAKSTAELKNSLENIQKAIVWAGESVRADIIFMSFGVSRKDGMEIEQAIEKVERTRNEDVIFLASAGNSDTDDESFPACHRSVIAVYATDNYGKSLPTNPMIPRQKAWVIGTYGQPPDFLRDEFTDLYPGICEAGSSVATAVMAGISAAMLAYATVLPSLVGLPCSNLLGRLWTTQGMEALLNKLATDGGRMRAVKPPVFWRHRPDNLRRCFAFIDSQTEVERQHPRRQHA